MHIVPALLKKITMEKTWRWFGENDKISLQTLRQIGVEGIVSALHHISNAKVWPLEEIQDYKNILKVLD